jgi:hypothetical protein
MLINVGSILILFSFGALKGYYNYFIKELLLGDKKLFSIGYILSIIATIYASVVMKSYIFTVISLIAEGIFFLYFACASFPGG